MLIHRLQRLRWSIRVKIGLGFALVLFCFIANGLAFTSLLLNVKNASDQQKESAKISQRLQYLDVTYASEIELYSDAAFLGRNAIRDSFSDRIFNQIVSWQSSHINKVQNDFENKFTQLYSDIQSSFDELTSLIKKSNSDQAKIKFKAAEPAFNQITQLITNRSNEVKADETARDKALSDAIFWSIITVASFTAFSIFLVILILWLNEHVLIRPINTLQKGLENIAAGDFEQQLEIPNRDEIGKLVTSFGTALGYLRQMVRGVRIGEQLQLVTGQLSSVSSQQKTGATEQVSALMQVLASTQELERTAAQIAESAAQVAELSNNTLEEIGRVENVGNTNQQRTQKMAAAVSSTLSGVVQVGQQVEELSQLMGELGKRTDKIEKVVELLGSIADEVHLLALNASIEAAGAGEYGDRFRVVAQQIKQLAKRANQATGEVNGLIRDVQGSCRDATLKVDEGLNVVSVVVVSSGELGQALEELELGSQQIRLAFNQVRQISDKLNNEAEGIKQATAQQRISSTQVIGAVNLVEGVAQQNVTSAQQVVISTSGLENLTHQLNEVLSQVKLAA